MKILLTGGSGFLGSALAARWAADGHELTLLLRASSSLRRLEALTARVRTARCSTDEEIAAAVRAAEPELIVHTACSYGRQGETPLQTFDANTRFGLVLVTAALAAAPDRRTAFLNTGTVLAPEVGDYALSKHQFSQWGATLAHRHATRLQFVDVRLQHMYGPHDDDAKFTTHVIRACRRGEPRLALTAGEQQRDFVYIDDVVDAYETIRRHLDIFETASEIDVGSGDAPTVRRFVETVQALTGTSTVLDFGALPYRPNEAMHCQADIAALTRLGWQPRFDLRSGLQKTLDTEFPQ